MWNEEGVEIKATSNSKWVVHAVVTAKLQKPWILSSIYASTNKVNRKRVWDEMAGIDEIQNADWMVMGDLNTIASVNEKVGGRIPKASKMEELKNVMNQCGIIDLGAHGPRCTWNNKRTGMANIKKRLDKVLANPQWCSRFPNAQDEGNFLEAKV